jgi:hypothetical protein
LLQLEKYGEQGQMKQQKLRFYKDMKLGETKVKAGTYTLYAIPEKTAIL